MGGPSGRSAASINRGLRSMADHPGQQVQAAEVSTRKNLVAGMRQRGIARRGVSGCDDRFRTMAAAKQIDLYLFFGKRPRAAKPVSHHGVGRSDVIRLRILRYRCGSENRRRKLQENR